MLNPKLLEQYWAIEQQKTNLALAYGMTLPRFMQHINHVPAGAVLLMQEMLRRQLTLLRFLRVKGIVENVIFVNFGDVI
jgi:hypothetical protein